MSNRLYKVPNFQKADSLNNPSAPHSSGIYYGRVVAVEDGFNLNEGLIKVNIPAFDKGNKPFCKDYESKTLQTDSTTLKRVQGNDLNTNFNSLLDIKDQQKVDFLTKKPTSYPVEEITNNPCTEVPYAAPLLPKNIQMMPKIGEMCIVFIENVKMPQLNRYWIGPLMSDKSKLGFESSDSGADLLNSNVIPKKVRKNTKEGKNLDKKGDFTGGFPERLDVSIMGRNNADIVLPTRKEGPDKVNTGGEVLIRAGKFEFNNGTNNNLRLNTKNPGFLRIKVMENGNEAKNSTTHSMMYSDYISLVSYKNSDGTAGLPKIKKINPLLEKDEDLFTFHNALSPLVRGDRLVEFLRLLVDYVKNHNHPYPKLPATNANSKPQIEKFDLISILSPHIRIN